MKEEYIERKFEARVKNEKSGSGFDIDVLYAQKEKLIFINDWVNQKDLEDIQKKLKKL